MKSLSSASVDPSNTSFNSSTASQKNLNPLCTLFDREGQKHEINLKSLESWGELSLAFTSKFKEATSLQLELDISSDALSKLIKFFKDWAIDETDNKTDVWNSLQQSILEHKLSDIIEQVTEIYILADRYFITDLRKFIQNIVVSRNFSQLINEKTIEDLEKTINRTEKREDVPYYKIVWLGLINHYFINRDFDQIDLLFHDVISRIGMEFTDWMVEALPIESTIFFLNILCSKIKENSQFNLEKWFDFGLSLLKKHFPNYFHYSTCSSHHAFFTYMLMTIVNQVQSVEQAQKIFTCLSELSPPEKQNYLKISEKEKEKFTEYNFIHVSYFNTAPSLILTLVFEQIFYKLFIQNNDEEIEKLINIWRENLQCFEKTSIPLMILNEIFNFYSQKAYSNQSFPNFDFRINATKSYFKIRDSLQRIFDIPKEEANISSQSLYTSMPATIEMTEHNVEPLLSLLEKMKDEAPWFTDELLKDIDQCKAPQELKDKIFDKYEYHSSLTINTPQINFDEVFDLWKRNRYESIVQLRRLIPTPLNRFRNLKRLVHEFCRNSGYEAAIEFSSVLNEEEKNTWIRKISQYIINIDHKEVPLFLESLKKCQNPEIYLKTLNNFCLKISNVEEYIKYLKTIIKFLKYEHTIYSLTLKDFTGLGLHALILNTFKFTDPVVFKTLLKLISVIEQINDDSLKNQIRSINSAINLIEGNYKNLTCNLQSNELIKLQLDLIRNTIDIIKKSPISLFKTALQIATNKITHSSCEDFNIAKKVINNRLIKTCWNFFKDSSFEPEREFLLDQLLKLKDVPFAEKLGKKLSFMLYMLSSDVSFVEHIQDLRKLGTLLGKRNDVNLLNKIKNSNSSVEDKLKRNLTLVESYLKAQNQTKNLDALDSLTSLNFSESLILYLQNLFPNLQVDQDKKEKENS